MSLPIGISGLMIIAYARIDQVIVFAIAGSNAAGLYEAVYNVLDQSHFVPFSILTTLAPVMAAAWPADRARMLRAARLTAELLAIASFGGLAFACVLHAGRAADVRARIRPAAPSCRFWPGRSCSSASTI